MFTVAKIVGSLVVAATALLFSIDASAQAPPPPPSGTPPPPPAAPLPSGSVLTPPARQDYEQTVNAVVERFKPSYVRRGAQRIAVYWNRQLTDRINQWVADERLVIGGQAAASRDTQSTKGPESVRLSGSTEKTVTRQRRENDVTRPAPPETWGWEFESGFLDPLMRASARIVDRATIIRLTAARAKGAGVGSVGAPDTQTLEINALEGYADLLVEILVSPAPQSPLGYEMNAVVKDIKTGTLMAHVNARHLPPSDAPQYVATSRGFELRQHPPELRRIASDLSLAVMDALTNYWRRAGGS